MSRRPGVSIGASHMGVSAAEPRQGRLMATGTFVYASIDGLIMPIGSPGFTYMASIRSDHRHGDRRDNRIAKLRQSFGPENHWNSRRRKATGYKGVYPRPSGKFRAKIRWYGSEIHIGTYQTAEEAARNYDVHAYCLFGDFARPNGSLARLKAALNKPNPRRKRRGAKRSTARPLRRNRALRRSAA